MHDTLVLGRLSDDADDLDALAGRHIAEYEKCIEVSESAIGGD
jgi:hypothetical protein